MLYTVLVTVQVSAVTVQEADGYIRLALDGAKKAEIVHLDSEVIDQLCETEDDEPEKLTRQKRLQGLADRGTDSWEEARGER